jgi:hypothetical protein
MRGIDVREERGSGMDRHQKGDPNKMALTAKGDGGGGGNHQTLATGSTQDGSIRRIARFGVHLHQSLHPVGNS